MPWSCSLIHQERNCFPSQSVVVTRPQFFPGRLPEASVLYHMALSVGGLSGLMTWQLASLGENNLRERTQDGSYSLFQPSIRSDIQSLTDCGHTDQL